AELGNDARSVVLFKSRHAVRNPIGAHLQGIIVVDGDARLRSRLEKQRLEAKILLGHFLEQRVQRRHDARHHDPRDVARLDPVQIKKVANQNAVLVGGLTSLRGQPPLGLQRLTLKYAQDGVRVPYVDDQKLHLSRQWSVVSC